MSVHFSSFIFMVIFQKECNDNPYQSLGLEPPFSLNWQDFCFYNGFFTYWKWKVNDSNNLPIKSISEYSHHFIIRTFKPETKSKNSRSHSTISGPSIYFQHRWPLFPTATRNFNKLWNLWMEKKSPKNLRSDKIDYTWQNQETIISTKILY